MSGCCTTAITSQQSRGNGLLNYDTPHAMPTPHTSDTLPEGKKRSQSNQRHDRGRLPRLRAKSSTSVSTRCTSNGDSTPGRQCQGYDAEACTWSRHQGVVVQPG